METEPFVVRKWKIIISGIFVLIGLYLTTLYNYLLFHSIAEAFIIVVACGIYIVAWNSRRFLDNNYLLFIGIAYLFIAVLEFIHTLGYTGMGIFKGYGTNLATQLWIAARYMESLSLLIAPLFLGRRIRLNVLFIAYASATCLILLSIFLWNIFPVCFVEGAGLTPFKKISEYIICLILIGSIALLFQKRKEFEVGVCRFLFASILLTIAAELAFTFYIHAYGFSNLIGHYFTIISFYLIYKAIIETGLQKPYDLLFRNLKKNEASLRSIFKAAPTGIGLVRDRVISEVNDKFCEIVGYSREELLEKNARFLYPTDEDYEYVGKVKYEQIDEAGTGTVETRLKRKDGKVINVLVSSSPLSPDDLSQGVTFTVLDITERKQAEEALKESEERYRSMMESMKDAAYICSQGFRIEYINPAMIDRIGRDATGEICHKAIYDRDEKCSWCVFDQIEKIEHVDYEVADPKGNRYYSVSNSPISHTDGTVSKLTVSRDITEIKTMEESLRQGQKMESIGTLTGGIAHDFNNILGVIVGNTELALDDVPEWNPAHSCLEEIKTASIRATNIVRQLLSFSRKTKQKLYPIEIALVIKDALKFLRSTIPTTIDIQQDIQATDETILADPTQINQIMMNLCINASQAMEQTGGNLTVNVEKVILDDNSAKEYPDLRSGRHVKVTVSDTGPGIDPKIIDRIFDPYFSTKEVGKGSGMGLAVVQGIVKNHGGAILVDSRRGEGTTFSILFPLAEGRAEIETETTQELPTGSETILFVDDEISIAKMVKKIFELLGYKVEASVTPQDALERFRLNPDHFDLVITDMTMPQMTGVKLSEKIMEIRPGVPVIICTGHSALIDEERAKQLGIAAYVMKPINMPEIAQTIRKVLDK